MADLSTKLKDRVLSYEAQTPEGAYKVALQHAQQAHRNGHKYEAAVGIEATVLKDWRYAGLYARHVLEGRFSAFEFAVQEAAPTTSSDDQLAIFHYAQSTLKGPWKEAEKHLETNAFFASRYAADVRREAWPEGSRGHETIMADPAIAANYLADMVSIGSPGYRC